MRVQPHSDTHIVNDHIGYPLDPSAETPGVSSHMGIDATIKVPERFKNYPPLSVPSDGLLAAIEQKYGRLSFYSRIIGNK
jgi:3-polyprenyl-4-hydroxybenzoate decarboxylase